MKFAPPVCVFVLLLALTGCVADGDYLYSRSGLTLAQYHSDRADCQVRAQNAADAVSNGTGRPAFMAIANETRGSPAYRRGNAMAAASNTVFKECYEEMDYVQVPLTAREREEFQAVQDWEAKLEWMDDFVLHRSQERVRKLTGASASGVAQDEGRTSD